MRAFCVFPVLLSVVMSQNSASIEYLRGVPRHGDASFVDYFFSCNATGSTLGWDINGTITLSFPSPSTGLVVQRILPNMASFATLLSISRITNDTCRFGSILVVSSTIRDLPLNIRVECFSGSANSSTSTNAPSIENRIVMNATGNIFLQYLFSTSILSETSTHVYSCGVNSIVQGWVVNNSLPLLLTSSNQLGSDQRRVSADNFATQQSILISMETYNISSVFFVTGPEILDVGCESTETNVNIDALQVMRSLMPTDPIPSPTTTPTIPPPTNATTPPRTARRDPCPHCDKAIAPVIIGVLLITCCIACIVQWMRWFRRGRRDAKRSCDSTKTHATRPFPMGDMSKEQLQVEDMSKEMPA